MQRSAFAMGVLLCLSVTGIAAVHADSPSGDLPGIGEGWELLPDMPEARALHAVAADGQGRIYSFGGTSDAPGQLATRSVFRFDPSTQTWESLPLLPQALSGAFAVHIEGSIYLPGDASRAETFVFDTQLESWTILPANGGYSPRSQYGAVALGNQLYVLGGVTTVGGSASTEVWSLDTVTGIWNARPAMESPRISFSAATVGNQVVVSGGVGFPGFAPVLSTEIFDGQSWSAGADVPDGGGAFSRWSYNAAVSDGQRLWLAGGRRDSGWTVLDHTGFYRPQTTTWETSPLLPRLNQPRVYLAGAVGADGYFHVLGGRNASATQIYPTHERLLINGPSNFEVGGAVINLRGAGLHVTETVSSQTLSLLPGDLSYAFELGDGSAFQIEVTGQPGQPNQVCDLEPDSGQVQGTDQLTLDIICLTREYAVGGTVIDLEGAGLVIEELESGQTVTLQPGEAQYAFDLEDGSDYRLSISAQAVGQLCQLSNALGQVNGGVIDNADVTCFPVGIEVAPVNLDLGPVELGEVNSGVIQISNPGLVDLTLLSLDSVPAP
ncbi:MAG: hypothetical protein AAGJ52_05155, partial [Pseudomonadota bacterium]